MGYFGSWLKGIQSIMVEMAGRQEGKMSVGISFSQEAERNE